LLVRACCPRLTHFFFSRFHPPPQLYKGFRADNCNELHRDFLSEAHKMARAEQVVADGDTDLKAAVRDGDAAAAARHLEAAAPPERDAAFVVACAHERGALLAAVPGLGQGGSATRVWGVAWRRAAANGAAREMGAAVVAALVPGAKGLADGVDEREVGGKTALMLAAEGGHDLAVRRLLEAGADVRLALCDGRTPLYLAAANGHGAVAGRLLAAGAVVDQADEHGETPLYNAAGAGHETAVQVLVAAGAVLDQAAGASMSGCYPLFLAAAFGHEAMVGQLLAAGAAVDLALAEGAHADETNAGATPLMKAAQGGHVGMARLLLAAGADPDRRSETQGITPRSRAAATGGAIKALFANV
jgi:hypothetical protein